MRFRRTFSKAVFFTWLKAAVLTVLLNLWFLVPFLTLMLSGDYNNMYTGSAENGGQIVKNSGLRIAELFCLVKNHNNLGTPVGFIKVVGLTIGVLSSPWRSIRRCLGSGYRRWPSWAYEPFPWQAVGRIPVVGRILVAIQFPGRYLSLATVLLVLAAMCGLAALAGAGLFAAAGWRCWAVGGRTRFSARRFCHQPAGRCCPGVTADILM